MGVRGESNHGGTQHAADEADSFYTARGTLATEATTARGGRAMSEAPSIANPLKAKTQKSSDQGRMERSTGGRRRLTVREDATEMVTPSEKVKRPKAKGGSKATKAGAMGMETGEGSGITSTKSGQRRTTDRT
jgi:hypothetical protein